MRRFLIVGALFFLMTTLPAISAEEKPLTAEEVLRLKNFELSLQNMQLQIEVLNREIQKFKKERDIYLEELYEKHDVDQNWRIDLEKGVWFRQENPTSQ